MIPAVQLGAICSMLRIAALASVVGTAFLRLDSDGFVDFSQFHVALSLAGFIECLVVIERSKLYDAGAAGRAERLTLLRWARRLGICTLVIGAAVSTLSLSAGPLIFGAGIAILALPESAALRDQPNKAARLEFSALSGSLLLLAASWLMPSLDTRVAVANLALLAVAPRLTLAMVMQIPDRHSCLRDAQRVVRRNFRSIAPFAISQAALPWLFAVPTYAVPMVLPARDASWILLGLRASGSVASMLARTLVQRWIHLADGHELRGPPRMALNVLGAGGVSVIACTTLGLPDFWTAIVFAAFLSIACAILAILSTHLNARGRYLIQLPAYAGFWLTGSAALLLSRSIGWPSATLAAFCTAQVIGAILAVSWMARLATTLNSVNDST